MGITKKNLFIAVFLLVYTLCGAQETGPRHLARLGWGDMLFETLAFHPGENTSHYGYTGHFFADYHYKLTRVVSVGAQMDFQGIFWTENKTFRSRNYDLCLLPQARFTWMNKEWVRLYSGLGAGLLFAFDNAGGHAFAPVFHLNTLGIQVGKGHWCGSVDLGLMASLNDLNRIYLFGSRLLSVSVNYRW